MRSAQPRAVWRMSLFAAASLLFALAGRPRPVAGAQAACEAGALFAAPISFGVGSAPQAIATGDLNGDGRPDLAVADSGESSASVLLNSTAPGAASPSFSSQFRFPTGLSPYGIALGDFDGDGRPDLASANHYAASVSVLLNSTTPGALSPSFTGTLTFTTPLNPSAAAVADFNGDHLIDLAVANALGNNASVFLNHTAPAGAPAFAQKSMQTGFGPSSVAVADFNADGRPDLATADVAEDGVSVLLNTTEPADTLPFFTDQVLFPTGLGAISVAAGELNGDGKPDLVVANNFFSTISVLRNSAEAHALVPSFVTQPAFAAGSGPFAVALADLNADGRLDLVVANEFSNTVSVFLNTTPAGAPAITLVPHGAVATGARPHAIAIEDLNSDGRLDLAVSNTDAASVSVLINQAPPATLVAASGTPQRSWVRSPFALPLQVRLIDGCGVAIAGVAVTFGSPASGASAALSAGSAVTDADGRASVLATANGITGSYIVSASLPGTSAPVAFQLANELRSLFVPLMRR